MEDRPASRPPGPGNPNRSRDHFRWDERHHQPHTDMSKWQKLWASRSDAVRFARLAGRNLRLALPVARRYRALLSRPPAPRPVAGDEFGIAISPTRATWPRYEDRLRDLGVRSLLVRIPAWAPGPVFELRDDLARMRKEGVELTFTLLQDRATVNDPRCWGAFVHEAADCFGELAPTFQVGHAINRKKWGIWHPDEYVRLLEATAPVRERFPACGWIGPPVIDFEYYFTASHLAGPRPFDFDGIAALLYVDRRGSPDAVQYRHFDLRRKIVLLRAVVQASGHPDVPIHLTEFNWPLLGTGKHSPAGAHVQTDEAGQARFLTLYYLTAAATGDVVRSFWWQLVARGYGLLDDDERWTARPSFHALKTLIARTVGWGVQRLPDGGAARGFLLRRGDEVAALVHAPGSGVRLSPGLAVREAADLSGRRLEPSGLVVGADPAYLAFGAADADEIVRLLNRP